MACSFSGLPKTAQWLSVAVLYAFYIWGHIPVSNICYALSDRYTPEVYRYYVLLTGKLLLTLIVLGLIVLIAKSQQRLLKAISWVLFSATLFLSYNSLVKISIEYVHFIQYSGLTVLLCYIFPKHLYLAVLLALFAGFMDEAYQAYPNEPLNWRDGLLNVVGVALGRHFFWTLSPKISEDN